MSAFLPYQSRWYSRKATLRVCEKARRVGISWAEAARQVLLASRSRNQGGCDCFYISTSQKLGREYIAACADWVRNLNLASSALGLEMVDERQGLTRDEIVFKSGFSIRALTSNPESMRGMGGDVIIDEAAHHLDLDELLRAASALGDWGENSLTVISTHNGAENPFALLCEELRSGEREGILERITIEDALRAGLHKRRCQLRGVPWTQDGEDKWLAKKLKGWGAEQEYLVIPSRVGTTFLRQDLIEDCSIAASILHVERKADHHKKPESQRVAEVERWCRDHLECDLRKVPLDRITTVGVDFARSLNGDLSVIALLTEERDLRKVCPFLVEMRNVPYEEQWAVLQHICDRLAKGRWGGVSIDRGGNGDWLSRKAQGHYGEALANCVSVNDSWYSANLGRFRAAFEEGQIAVPRDADVRDDLLMFEVRGGIPKMSKERRKDSKDSKPRHGDSGMALALAFAQHAKAPPKIEFTRMPVGKARKHGL